MTNVLQGFMSKVRVDESGCWLWTGSIFNTGYGLVYDRGKNRSAHRVSWELHHGPIPTGMYVCHTCDVRACVNPDHLWLGTHVENQADALAKGRKCRGEKMPTARLTEADVRDIRTLASGGHVDSVFVGALLGVGAETIRNVITRHTWRHVCP